MQLLPLPDPASLVRITICIIWSGIVPTKVGVTLKTLWEEYMDKYRDSSQPALDYRRFCEGYSNFTVRMNLTNHLDHKPGARTEVDWPGPTMFYTDPKTGEIVKVYLFVIHNILVGIMVKSSK